MTRLFCLALLLALLAPAQAQADDTIDKRSAAAVRVLREIMQSPDQAIPGRLLRTAEAIVVVPDVVKAGLVVGGRHGKGLLAVRSADGTWSNPVFVSLTGGSIGFQAGVQSSDVILVFRTSRGVDSIVNGKFTLGADAAVAAGPVGRNASASTDAQLKAEIYSYSRARGLFAGVALQGSAITIDFDLNAEVYGKGITPRRVFAGGVDEVPSGIVDFRDALEEHTAVD